MIPESCWSGVFAKYRDAVGKVTEAPDSFHYMSLLSVIGTLLAGRIHTWYAKKLYTNFYVVLLGESEQTKKTTSIRFGQTVYGALAKSVGAQSIMGISSAEGLLRALGQMPPVDEEVDEEIVIEGRPSLMFMEEFSTMLRKARQESLANLTPMVTALYDTPEEVSLPTRRSPLRVMHPMLSILGGTTPDWIESSLKEEEIMGGFANRFIFTTGDPKAPVVFPIKPELSPTIAHIAGALGFWKTSDNVMTWSDDAKEVWKDFYTWWRIIRAPMRGVSSVVTSRVPEQIVKIAMVFAALDRSVVIERRHMYNAVQLGKSTFDTTLDIFGHWPMSEAGKLESRILEMLENDSPLSRSELHRRLSGRVRADVLNGILKGLEVNDRLRQYKKDGTSYIRLTTDVEGG